MEGLVPFVPDIQDLLSGFDIHNFREGMGLGKDLRLPSVVTALNGQAYDHRLEVGAGIVDVLHFFQRHGRDPVALLADHHHQMFGHQLRKRLSQRANPQVITLLEPTHEELLSGLEDPANDVLFESLIPAECRVLLGGEAIQRYCS
ncbi:hypothetical protein D9M71_486090 [compost metagenome]